MTKHTPGPWAVKKVGERAFYVRMFIGSAHLPSSATGFADFAVQPYQFPDKAEANARLIAAAPEMLAALKLALDDFGADYIGDTIDAMRDAIAKAEGTAQEPPCSSD